MRDRRDDPRGMLMGGLIVLGVGVLFLLHNLGLIPDMEVVWPMFPILVGLALIVGALMRMRDAGGGGT
jgi:hypothetical protein